RAGGSDPAAARIVALRWTSKAQSGLARLYDFLRPVNPTAATQLVRQLAAGAKRIPTYPRLGVRLPEFDPREVRRVLVGDYELRYELTDSDVFALWLIR